jgi:phosphomannomutase
VAVAGDGRAIVPEFVAAACEGLRWAACEAFDIGPATSASLEFAIAHFRLDGGILLGNVTNGPASICLKFCGPGPRRMRGIETFRPLQEILRGGLDRPARRFAPQHRLLAEALYLAALADWFHGLRPLKFVVDSTSRPWVAYLEKLLRPTACRMIPCRVLPDEFSKQIAADNAHFGVRVTNDGECCTFFNEQGKQVGWDQRSKVPPRNRDNLIASPENGGTSLRWSHPTSDAIRCVARFLQLLSRDDRPCSAVLDDSYR